jgi:hypothetical protein
VVGGGASSNSIGGATASARNTISGNTLGGVFIAGDATTGNHVDRNAIGTAAAGGAGVPNGVGIEIAGSSGNHVGDGSAARANTIRFNTGSGVVVDAADGPANGNSVLANSIDSNGGLGINLLNGANDEQAAPEITSVLTFFQTTIQGTISGSPSTGYRIEVFSGPDCDPSGSGEGRAFRGFTEISTNTDGNASFSVDVPSLAHGLAVTATATSDDGSTSEFSACELSP